MLLASGGMLTGYDAKTGKKLWEKDFEPKFDAVAQPGGQAVYLIGEEGKGLVVEPADKGCKEVGRADLGEACVASPAFQDGRIYLRGEETPVLHRHK